MAKVETVVKSTRGMGTHDYNALKTAYPASPIHGGNLDDATVKDLAQALLLDDVVEGNEDYPSFNPNYTGAPDISSVDVAGKNLASPYVPNPTSPGPGSMNASDIGDAPDGFGQEPNDQFGTGVGSQLSPDQSSAAQSTGQIGKLDFGKAPGST
jgi:hypothetical protein